MTIAKPGSGSSSRPSSSPSLAAVALDPQAAALGQLGDVGGFQQQLVERLALDDQGRVGVGLVAAGPVAEDAVANA